MFTPISVLTFNFPIVVVERLQVLVAVDGGACQPHVQGSQHPHVPAKETWPWILASCTLSSLDKKEVFSPQVSEENQYTGQNTQCLDLLHHLPDTIKTIYILYIMSVWGHYH